MLALWLVLGCAHRIGNAQFANYKFRPPPSTPTWPSFLAEDYRTFHKRTLTRGEVALIRKTLALVKPCQRALLRFAFSSNRDVLSFVLFFQTPYGAGFHVLWTSNMYFKPEDGTVFPVSGPIPPWHGIRYDVEHTTCA
jgi:hypothetical protein